LTKQEAPVTAYANAKAEPNVAIVEVADDRIRRLSEMYQPRKTIFSTIEFIDFVGVTKGSAREGLFSGPGKQVGANRACLHAREKNKCPANGREGASKNRRPFERE